MYAIMGITGRVGSVVATTLMASGHGVRAIVRDPTKGEEWRNRGVAVNVAEFHDVRALANAFRDSDGAFIMVPPVFDPAKGFPETTGIVGAIRAALAEAKPAKIVCLSSIGAQHDEGIGVIFGCRILERDLGDLDLPRAFLRAAWFMENAAWDVDSARRAGRIDSFLQPVDRAVPMVATDDVGRCAASLLLENWTGRRIVELEGPERVSPAEMASAFAGALDRDVRAEQVPRLRWPDVFRAQGTKWPQPRCEMIDGFNSGWIEFEGEPRRGTTRFADVATKLVSSVTPG